MSWFDQALATDRLVSFFNNEGGKARDFGNRVYQTYEATTFAQTIKWYSTQGWKTKVVNPGRGKRNDFRLKFSTRGDAKNFTYVKCYKGDDPRVSIQIRHQIRVETHHHFRSKRNPRRANIVCDVAVLIDKSYDHIVGSMHVFREDLITFGEAKHMDAYAELVASFIGIVHELQPWRLSHDVKRLRHKFRDHPKPFLNISGTCMPTAEGIKISVKRRRLDIDIYDSQSPFMAI